LSDILDGIILVIVCITLFLIVVAVSCVPKEEEEEEKKQKEWISKSSKKICQNAISINLQKPSIHAIKVGGRLVLTLESNTHCIGICLKNSAIEQLYENLGVILRLEALNFEGGEDDEDEDEDEDDGFINLNPAEAKSKIKISSNKSNDMSQFYS
jgi:hypothetical protein